LGANKEAFQRAFTYSLHKECCSGKSGPKNQSAFDVSLGNVVAEGVREAH
jgi:hypothetical protein